MATILFNIETICDSQFKCNYLKNENLFLNFLLDFSNLHKISNILKKKVMVIANVFPKLETVKVLVRPPAKKHPFRKGFDWQRVKVSQILAKSPWQHIYHLCSSFWGKLIWKRSPLVLGETLRMFVDTLSADAKYPVEYYESFRLPIEMQLSEKRKTFSNLLLYFSNLHQMSNILRKKMVVIANVFPKLQTVKKFVGTFSQIPAKSPWHPIYHVFVSFWEKLFWKLSVPGLREILRVSVDTLPADGNYPVEYYENLLLPIQMQLSEKRKPFS